MTASRSRHQVLWCAVILLVVIGAAASIARTVFLPDLVAHLEPVREDILDALGIEDAFARERSLEQVRFDRRFAAHPLATLLHIVPGGLFLLLAPLQFSSRVRHRHLELHRWSGRFLALTAMTAASTGLYFGLFLPFAGTGESIPIALFGGLLLYATATAVVAIRNRQVARHREWMIRAFALALAISTVRIVGAVVDLTLTPRGLGSRPAFVIAIWTGWGLTLGAAEIWIRETRSTAMRRGTEAPTP